MNIHIYNRESGLGLPRRVILWDLLLIWFQQTSKMTRGELLAYIFGGGGQRKWGREKRKQGRQRSSETDTVYECVCVCVYHVSVSILSKHVHGQPVSLQLLSVASMNEEEEKERMEIYKEKTE